MTWLRLKPGISLLQVKESLLH